MTKVVGTSVIALLAAFAFAGCSAGMSVDGEKTNANTVDGTGGVNFDLDLPNGESISTINLHLSCADGIEQDHVLNVVNGEVVAAIGGLTPGECTATMTAQTPDGTDCIGAETFIVVADQTVDVTVTLMCQGINDGPSGQAKIGATFEIKECDVDRIKKIYAIPANVLLGESTVIEVETWDTLVTTLNPETYSYATANEAPAYLGEGTVTPAASCAPDSSSCADFTCTGLGASTQIDASTGLPVAGVWIEVTVEDDDCYDTEKVWVECLQASECGDGAVEGVEECDGTVGVGVNEECDATTCKLLYCGDGVVNVAEECDGTDGVGPGESCNSSCVLEYCGDGIQNGSEECDGNAGLVNPLVQECAASCVIVAECGNGIQEGTEECDGTDGVTGSDTCNASCEIVEFEEPNFCLDCLSDPVNEADALVASCLDNTIQAGCGALLQCLTTSDCYWPNPSDCYCGNGADPDVCEGPSFPADGDCKAEMLTVSAATNNADALSFVYTAFQLMSYGANIACTAECQL